MFSSRTEATNLINEIVSNCNVNNICEVPQICIKLTKHLFSHQYLMYTDLNKSFETTGILLYLIKCLDRLEEPPQRDVLRLVHLLLQANKSLRDTTRQLDDFQTFLRLYLDRNDCWINGSKYKHHINIASLLLSDRESTAPSFNPASVHKLVLKKIESAIKKQATDVEDMLPYIVFYACSMLATTSEDIPANCIEEPATDLILTKELTGRCLDIFRDYVQDFKLFYMSKEEGDRTQYILYKAKSEFSFQQITCTAVYYAKKSKQLRMNIYQSGIYHIINNLFSLKDIPEHLLLCGIEILKISLIDETILSGVKTEFLKPINTKLKFQISRENLSEKLKSIMINMLNIYEIKSPSPIERVLSTDSTINSLDIPSGDFVPPHGKADNNMTKSITNMKMNQFRSSISMNFEEWSKADVRKWLLENNLEYMSEVFSYLTGSGLKQLQLLVKQSDRLKFIEFLTGVMKIRLDMSLELISALEKL